LRRLIALSLSLLVVLAACSSGPSPEALERNQRPSTTTTTEPPPEGVTVVGVIDGRFEPSILQFTLDEFWIVEFENRDTIEYQITSQTPGQFESPVLAPGDTWQLDMRDFEPGLHRYVTFVGNQRIPGLINTNPER
jgi:hypothetical protein